MNYMGLGGHGNLRHTPSYDPGCGSRGHDYGGGGDHGGGGGGNSSGIDGEILPSCFKIITLLEF